MRGSKQELFLCGPSRNGALPVLPQLQSRTTLLFPSKEKFKFFRVYKTNMKQLILVQIDFKGQSNCFFGFIYAKNKIYLGIKRIF